MPPLGAPLRCGKGNPRSRVLAGYFWWVCLEIKGHLSQSFGLLPLTVSLKFGAELRLILTFPVLSAVPAVNWPCERVWQVVA